MKKLIVIVGLLITVPVAAMEDFQWLNVTKEENNCFIDHVSKAVAFNKRMVEEKKIPENNSIHVLIHTLSKECTSHGNNVRELLRSNVSLSKEICNLRERVESDSTIQKFLQQISDTDSVKNIKKVREDLVNARHMKSEVKFLELCPQYKMMLRQNPKEPCFKSVCPQYFQQGDVSDQDRLNFMLNNADYLQKLSTNAYEWGEASTNILLKSIVNDWRNTANVLYKERYLALFMYQTIFAHQI